MTGTSRTIATIRQPPFSTRAISAASLPAPTRPPDPTQPARPDPPRQPIGLGKSGMDVARQEKPGEGTGNAAERRPQNAPPHAEQQTGADRQQRAGHKKQAGSDVQREKNQRGGGFSADPPGQRQGVEQMSPAPGGDDADDDQSKRGEADPQSLAGPADFSPRHRTGSAVRRRRGFSAAAGGMSSSITSGRVWRRRSQ